MSNITEVLYTPLSKDKTNQQKLSDMIVEVLDKQKVIPGLLCSGIRFAIDGTRKMKVITRGSAM